MERQSDTQAPHWMRAIVWVTSTMLSGATTYSRSDTGSLLISHGVTRWIFFQCTASMSTIRSLITGMLPIGSTVMIRLPSGAAWAARSRWVWQASPGLSLIRTPHDPQIAARHEQRIPIEPSTSSRSAGVGSGIHVRLLASLHAAFLRSGDAPTTSVSGTMSPGPVISRAPRPRVTKLNAQRVMTSKRFWKPMR